MHHVSTLSTSWAQGETCTPNEKGNQIAPPIWVKCTSIRSSSIISKMSGVSGPFRRSPSYKKRTSVGFWIDFAWQYAAISLPSSLLRLSLKMISCPPWSQTLIVIEAGLVPGVGGGAVVSSFLGVEGGGEAEGELTILMGISTRLATEEESESVFLQILKLLPVDMGVVCSQVLASSKFPWNNRLKAFGKVGG